MAPVLGTYQYVFGDNGYVLNTDYNGVLPFFDVDTITGLDGAPPRLNTTDRGDRDGSYVDASYMTMRTIVVSGTMYTNANDPDTILDRLRSEYGPQRVGLSTPYGLPQYSPTAIQPFYFQHPGKPLRFIMSQGGGAQYSVDTVRRVGQTALQLSLLAADPYIYDFPASDFTVGGNTAGPLNVNPYFENGISPWTPRSNATISQSSSVANAGYYSLKIVGDGVTAVPGASSENTISVTAGAKYLGSAFFYSSSSWATGVQVVINWFNSSLTFLSGTTGGAVALPASTWTAATLTATAPATAAFARLIVQVAGTPTSVQVFNADDATLLPAGGASFPFSFSANLGGKVVTSPTVTVFNAGTHDAYPMFTIRGPIKDPVITDSLTWDTMRFQVTLAKTDTLVVDTRNKAITLQTNLLAPWPWRETQTADQLSGTNFVDPTIIPRRPRHKAVIRNARATLQGMRFFTVSKQSTDSFYLSGSDTTSSTRFRVTMFNTYF